MLVDQKGLGKPPVFSGREEDSYAWANKVENYVSGVFPNVRGLSFAVESQDAVTATAVALGTDNSSWCCQPSRSIKASML